jgi:hypothetical protein
VYFFDAILAGTLEIPDGQTDRRNEITPGWDNVPLRYAIGSSERF